MLSNIRNDDERVLYQKQLENTLVVLNVQKTLGKDAQVQGIILDKLGRLIDYLKYEIEIYDKINKL